MTFKTLPFIIILFISSALFANDTLLFRLSNPWNTVKSPTGDYLRKCVKEKDYYHVWDYNRNAVMVTESFYSDTNFTRKLFCHKYFDETTGILEQSRCYENGRLHGYFVGYNSKGDTTFYSIYENGALIKEWSSEPEEKLTMPIPVEQPAKFPGGETAWQKYLNNNLTHPKGAENVSGQVIVRIKIDNTGMVKEVEIVQNLHPLIDEEVIRVLMKSPKWKPAKQNGKKVPTFITQPITF